MNKIAQILFVLYSLAFVFACSSSKMPVDNAAATVSQSNQTEEYIRININETIYFDFIKENATWRGKLTTYTLNERNEKVVDKTLISAQDSSWADFDDFVNFLNIYELPPQNEIKGWAPNSAHLPRRVYNFEIFDGDSTRSFSYQDPINDLRDYWQAQYLLTFMTFIENELNWIAIEPE